MSTQTVSALLTALIIAVIAGVFLRVRWLAHGKHEYTPVQSNAYRIRAWVFGVMVVVGLPISIWLFRDNPYNAATDSPQIINATGYQWYWELDRDNATVGKAVEFRVTSVDVNHGFGIYNEAGVMVAQTQAMPGYINRLVHTFDAPGTYQLLCLEYCGVGHHVMIVEILVTETKPEGGTGG